MHQLPDINALLSYENDQVIKQYCKDYPAISKKTAQQSFQDLLGWLWIYAYRSQKNIKTHLFGPLLKLDNLWHVFILHTREYSKFCETYFFNYIHHEFEPIGNEHELSSDELSDLLSDCYEYLGESWVLRNFAEIL